MGLNIIKFEDKISIKENPVAEANKVTAENINEIKKAINDLIFPIGSIIINASQSFDPNSSYGGTWEQFAKGQTLIGVDESQSEFNTVEKIGGEKVHKLTIDEIPEHNHTTVINRGAGNQSWGGLTGVPKVDGVTNGNANTSMTGGSQAHNNLPPYITVYFWKRTA